MKLIHLSKLLLCSLLLLTFSCTKNKVFDDIDNPIDYHSLSIIIESESDTRAANAADSSVVIDDLVLITVDDQRKIVNASVITLNESTTYSCRIPLKIDLSAVEFYAVANFESNFGKLSDFKFDTFDEFLDTPVLLSNVDNNGAKSLKYALMNRVAAKYDSESKKISKIMLSHLPARIFLDCSNLEYVVSKIEISNISTSACLRNLTKESDEEKAIVDFEDESPDISGDGNSYFYLVYPSSKGVSMTITSNGELRHVNLGTLKNGLSYKLRINYKKEVNPVIINGNVIGEYAAGESITVQAPFIDGKKFSHWITELSSANSATLTFTMPSQSLSLTATYTEAPYKVTINKPGRIVNSADGDYDQALVSQTSTSYIRYYASGDNVYIETPKSSIDGESEFKSWDKSSSTNNNIYNALTAGGGQNATTWFTVSSVQSAVELTASYHFKPYWSNESTTRGWIVANFIEHNNKNSGQLTIPGGTPLYRALSRTEKDIIMRVLNTVENTFANAPRRTIKITFAVIDLGSYSGIGAATDPRQSYQSYPYEAPKNTWSATDFGGRAAGLTAASTKFESVWRDQLNIVPEDADVDNRFIGFCDGRVLLNHSYIKDTYMGEQPSDIKPGQVDLESILLHEVAHIVCYHSLNKNANSTNGMMALDAFVVHAADHSRSVVNGNMEANDGGQAIILSELVKSYYGGRYLEVVTTSSGGWDFGHLDTTPGLAVGSQYRMGGGVRRKFVDFELALLQEMGWQINPAAWSNTPIGR